MIAVDRPGSWLALAWLVGLAAAPALAQAPRGVRTVYTNQLAFGLPVGLDERDRAEVRELKFYVREPCGPRPNEWVCLETAPPTKTRFTYRAAHDGEYWFAFATADKAGQATPTDLNRMPPGLVVIVDTQAPEVEVTKLPVASGETYLQCQIRDAHPDYAALRLEYQTPERAWRPLQPHPDAPGLFRVPDPGVLRGVVRASAADKAGNRAVREIDLGRDAGGVVTADHTQAAPAPPLADEVDAARTAEKQSPAEAGSAPRQILNTLRCQLEYALDTLNVTSVEAYATRDGGKSWMRLCEDSDRRSPLEFELPEDGVYGLALVVSTAGRPALPPAPGDAPDWWVEIDTVRPAVTMRDIQQGSGDRAGQLTLSWSAQDKNLGPEPVELLWAAQPAGPWQSAAKGLKAVGSAHWTVPREAGGQVYIRLEATDRAGNVGRWETREPVVLEAARGKARILGVKPVRGN
jgi:hypothetical protein